MAFFKIYLLFISYLNLNILFVNSFISLPFTYINKLTGENEPSLSNITNYFKSLFNNPIYTILNINNKLLKFHITMDRHTMYISEKVLKEIDPNAAFRNNDDIEDVYSLDYIGISRALYTTSSFSFILNNTKNTTSNNFSFFMTKKMINESELNFKKNYYAYENEEIGFNIFKGNKIKKVLVDYDPDDYYYSGDDYYRYITNNDYKNKKEILTNNGYNLEQNTNLIYQLKKQKLISSYSFLIKYNNKNEEKGEIIIGGLPHEYDPNHYSEQYFIYNSVSLDQNTPNWRITFNDIKYGDDSLNSGKIGEFSLDCGFIVTSISYKEYFDKNFFKNMTFADYCHEEKIGEYFVKYCDKEVIKEFKNIYFYFSTIYNDLDEKNKIEFDYNDLFIKSGNNNIYYFQIIFQSGYYKWLFGRPLFKKYPMIFDQNKKIIGLYTQTIENNNDEKKDKNEKKDYSFILILLLIFLFICLVCLAYLFVLCYKNLILKKRRKKAYELDDEDFDYNSTSQK